jgi:hypothetical protein
MIHIGLFDYFLGGMWMPTLALLSALITIVGLCLPVLALKEIAEVDGPVPLAGAHPHLFELQSLLQGAKHI